jgi:hypothetical protein
MGLVAGLGRWRQRHVDGVGLAVDEMATVLRVALPLVRVADDAGSLIRLSVAETQGDPDLVLWAQVAEDGSVGIEEEPAAPADSWATGAVEEWMAALLDGEQKVETGGDASVVERALADLYERLWTPSPF